MKNKKNEKGFTLVEGILAIAIAAVGLVLVFSLLTLSLDLNIKSQFLLRHATGLNSLADHLREKKARGYDDQAIDDFLQDHYPGFSLVGQSQTQVEGLVMLQVKGNDKDYYITYYGERDD